jgi:acyl-CoA thioester hydrolase
MPRRRPPAANVFLAEVRVRYHELDPLGHVNNAVYLNYLEQAAVDHAAAAGWSAARLRALGGVFIARRHEVDYLRPAVEGDRLRVATWAIALRGARAFRAYEVARVAPDAPPLAELATGEASTGGDAGADGRAPRFGHHAGGLLLAPEDVPPTERAEVVVRARTEWAYVDTATGRPRRIPPEVIAAFAYPEPAPPPGVR